MSPTKQFYHCFGCGAHGTAISFLIEHGGYGFVDAVSELAQQVGLTVPQVAQEAAREEAQRRQTAETLHDVMLEAARFYKRELKRSTLAIDYLKRRGLTGEIAARFGLASDDLPRLTQWIEGAGIRWGLSQSHRAELGLTACGEQNSWLFGLERMLLGYANGYDGPFAGIEPFAEVGGLDAALAGALAALVARLQAWRDTLSVPVTPNEWGERFTRLVEDFFTAGDERDRQTLVALAFQIPRQRKLKAAEAAKAQLAAETRNGRLGRGGGARELSRREAWRLGLVLQYIVDNALLGFAVSLVGANEGERALAAIGHGWLLVGMKIGLVL